MNKVQYWAHRLVPHMAFDDFIEKAEHLGSKKSIKVCHSVLILRRSIYEILLKRMPSNVFVIN